MATFCVDTARLHCTIISIIIKLIYLNFSYFHKWDSFWFFLSATVTTFPILTFELRLLNRLFILARVHLFFDKRLS